MDGSTLGDYRQGLYACFTRARDALFEVGDALLTASTAGAFVELSQAPGFQVTNGGGRACIPPWPTAGSTARRCGASAPATRPGQRLVLGLDTSPIHRPEAHTAADRTLVYAPDLPSGTPPGRPGWCCATVAVRPAPVSRWT